MTIRITGFAGEIPRSTPRLLGNNYAQAAIGAKLLNGAVTPVRGNALATTLGATPTSIFLYEGTWMSWASVVYAAPGPIATDRLYVMSGAFAPQLITGGQTYNLAINPPVSAPTVTVLPGPIDPVSSYYIVYAYTYVSQFGEESAPSPVSARVLVDQNSTLTITGLVGSPDQRMNNPSYVTGGDPSTNINIYRSETSASGVTTLYYVGSSNFATDTEIFVDYPTVNHTQYPITSANYNPPPADLTGLTSMPNGMMAAFSGKSVYFCEPFLPHAWPEIYILTTDYPIVGLGCFGSTLAVMTTGKPYLAQGTQPSSMTMTRMEVNLPCLNAQSIVDLGYAIAYSSPEGLVTISDNGASVVSERLFTQDEWTYLNSGTFIASRHDGRYVAAYNYVDQNAVAQSGTMFIDLSGDQPFLVRTADTPTALYYDIPTGYLYLASSPAVYHWDAPGQPVVTHRWRSKKFYAPRPMSFGAIQVEADPPLNGVPDVTSLVNVYADGALIGSTKAVNSVARLPGGFLATVWELEIVGTLPITSLSLGISPSDIGRDP